MRFYDYEEAAWVVSLSPRYIRKLCNTHKLTYVLKVWMTKGPDGFFYLRRKRLIPQVELLQLLHLKAARALKVILASPEAMRQREAIIEAARRPSEGPKVAL